MATLFFSDGTAAGTGLVCDFNPGPASGSPYQLVAVDGVLYFRASDHLHGYELFRLGSTPAVVERLGASCGSARPALDATHPVLGSILTLSGTGSPVGARILIFGVRTDPFPMPGILAPDCAIWSDLSVSASPALPAGTSWSVPLAVPAHPSLIGAQALMQAVEGILPLSASNAVQITGNLIRGRAVPRIGPHRRSTEDRSSGPRGDSRFDGLPQQTAAVTRDPKPGRNLIETRPDATRPGGATLTGGRRTSGAHAPGLRG